MPKKGRSDAYWQDALQKYARGEKEFKVGETPGKRKWKEAKKRIETCPRHHLSSAPVRWHFGSDPKCKCGYHENNSDKAGPRKPASSISKSREETARLAPAPASTTVVRSREETARLAPAPAPTTVVRSREETARLAPAPAPTTVVRSREETARLSPAPAPTTVVRSREETARLAPAPAPTNVVRSREETVRLAPAPAPTTVVRSLEETARLAPAPAPTTVVRSREETARLAPAPAPTTVVRSREETARLAPAPAPTTVVRSREETARLAPAPAPTTVVRSREETARLAPAPASTTVVRTSTCQVQSDESVICHSCKKSVPVLLFEHHLILYHVVQKCNMCVKVFSGDVALKKHQRSKHPQETEPAPTEETEPVRQDEVVPAEPVDEAVPAQPVDEAVPAQPAEPFQELEDPESHCFLPKQFRRVIRKCDQGWIGDILYKNGSLVDTLINQNWYHPPSPSNTGVPVAEDHFRQKMFLWAPMRMWHIPLRCPKCKKKMRHGGIYPKAREVVDLDSRYYLISLDYPRCTPCKAPISPWSSEVLEQLDPYHRNLFPAVLTQQQALDKRVATLMKPRTAGNSSSFSQQVLHEIHSEEWGRRCLAYLSACELHMKTGAFTGGASSAVKYAPPPPFRPLPLPQWFEQAHSEETFRQRDEMKAIITSTYGRVLKLDSTKKITKKLAGDVGETASWMTNVANEHGQVLNSVLTTGEGPALYSLCQGIVKRYNDAKVPPPQAIYVDRDCCEGTVVLDYFKPWSCHVRLDSFHFMRRFTKGLTTEHHPLYGTFCTKLSGCVYVWDREDVDRLRKAKKAELQELKKEVPTDQQVQAAITTSELSKHCRIRTRSPSEIKAQIDHLLQQLWDSTDTMGVPLIQQQNMQKLWQLQQKHLTCLQDPPGVDLYTKTGTLEKGGMQLDVLRCARGSSSLESFHRHQNFFIPGFRANSEHTQMYMLEGCSRWNLNRERDRLDLPVTSQTRIYDVRLMCNINTMSEKILGFPLLPEFKPPGKPTNEKVAVEYVLDQTGRGDMLPYVDVEESMVEETTEEELLHEVAEELPFSLHGTSDCQISSILDPDDGPTLPISTHTTEEDCQISSILDPDDGPTLPISTHTMEEDSLDDSLDDADKSRIAATPESSPEKVTRDAEGYPGYEAVDALAGYLVSLDTQVTSLSNIEENNICNLYEDLHDGDKQGTTYAPKSKKATLDGPWRTSRKRSGPTPGVQAAERLYMTHGQAAQSPTANRVTECVCLRLWKKYLPARNRPKDRLGKTLAIPQAIVLRYTAISHLLLDSQRVQKDTTIVLVPLNTTTVSKWLSTIQKRRDRSALLQGKTLLDLGTTKDTLPPARSLPSSHPEHGHEEILYTEPDNRQGQFAKRRYTKKSGSTITTTAASTNPAPRQTGPWLEPYGYSTPYGFPARFPAWIPQPRETPPPPKVLKRKLPPPQETPPPPRDVSPPSKPSTTPSSASPSPQHIETFAPPPQPYQVPYLQGMQAPYPQYQPPPQGYMPLPPPLWQPQGWYGWPPYQGGMYPTPDGSGATSSLKQPPPFSDFSTRRRDQRRQKAEKEDLDRVQRGEPPKKRHKRSGQYLCKVCNKQKCAETGHTQVKGKWYCPAFNVSLEAWKESVNKSEFELRRLCVRVDGLSI